MTAPVEHIKGVTFHARKGAIKNAFRYGVDYVLVDAEHSHGGPSLFSRNAGNIVALQDVDHGGAPGTGTGPIWVREVLAQYNISGVFRIELLAQPRMLGHVFNPVSFWLCRDENDALITVIAEVTNTYGDRHSYVCRHADLRPIVASDRLWAQKILHVSPFQPIDGSYEFRFDIRPDRIGIWIDYGHDKGGVIATLTGSRRVLNNRAILSMMLRRPFGSRRVLALIHRQALKLWMKGARFRARPPAPARAVSGHWPAKKRAAGK